MPLGRKNESGAGGVCLGTALGVCIFLGGCVGGADVPSRFSTPSDQSPTTVAGSSRRSYSRPTALTGSSTTSSRYSRARRPCSTSTTSSRRSPSSPRAHSLGQKSVARPSSRGRCGLLASQRVDAERFGCRDQLPSCRPARRRITEVAAEGVVIVEFPQLVLNDRADDRVAGCRFCYGEHLCHEVAS